VLMSMFMSVHRVGSLFKNAAQHSVHPTGGTLRVFRHFVWLEVVPVTIALPRPTHQRVTQAVGRRGEITEGSLEDKVEWLQLAGTPRAVT
jgi:hypothetical protein